MTCKDCIHCEACEGTPRFYDDEYIKDVTFSGDVRDLCPTFKNKADFVEVVRCRECKHCEIWNNDWFFCKKTVNDAEVTADDFCSYGERREDNG